MFAALAVPISYGLIKYSVTASMVMYATHLTTSLNSRSFNKPTLFTLRFGAKVVDVLASGVYSYYFREEIQEVAKVAGQYVEKYSPALIGTAFTYTRQFGTDYLIPITQLAIENVNYYITPYGIFVVTWVKDVTTNAILYAVSSRFIGDVTAFNVYLHSGPSIDLYTLAENSVELAQDLYTLAGELVGRALVLNEWLHEGGSINLYAIWSNILDFTIAVFKVTYEGVSKAFEALAEWGGYFWDTLSALSNLYIDLTPIAEQMIGFYKAFIELLATPVFELVGNCYITFLELCNVTIDWSFPIIYLDILADKIREIVNYSFDLRPELLLEQYEIYKAAFLQWLDEPFELTLEEITKAFIEWWNEPSSLKEYANFLIEHISFLASTYMFKVGLIAMGKVLIDSYIESTLLKGILAGVIINEIGEALRKAAEKVYANYAVKDTPELIDLKSNGTDSNPLEPEELRLPDLVIEPSYNMSGNKFCPYWANVSQAEVTEQALFNANGAQQHIVTYPTSFYTENQSEAATYSNTLIYAQLDPMIFSCGDFGVNP